MRDTYDIPPDGCKVDPKPGSKVEFTLLNGKVRRGTVKERLDDRLTFVNDTKRRWKSLMHIPLQKAHFLANDLPLLNKLKGLKGIRHNHLKALFPSENQVLPTELRLPLTIDEFTPDLYDTTLNSEQLKVVRLLV